MKKQKIILWLVISLLILGLGACITDKTPLETEEQVCWNKIITIKDYEYLKNRYFFVDTFYANYFEQGWSNDLSHWVYNPSRLLQKIEVFQSTTYSNSNTKNGLAVLDPHKYYNLTPSDYDTVIAVPGKVEKGNFIKLEEIVDYYYDNARGFFWLNSNILDGDVLAVSYKTDLDTIGTFFSEFTDTTKVPVFRLIKSRSMRPADIELWPLMIKNVYSLGDSMINYECFNMRIEYNLNGEHQTIQQVDPQQSYMNLMGLDRNDKNGLAIDGGDGFVDYNVLLVSRAYGILMFPGLQPFNPLSTSRFQIAEKADLYNTANMTDLQNNHKYDIIVTSKVNE